MDRAYFCTVVCLCTLLTTASAAEIPWKTSTYQQLATNRPIAEVLRDFAGDQGIGIVISEKVVGNLSGQFGPMTPQAFLVYIAQTNGLIWYYDGLSIYVYRSDETQTRVVQLQYATVAKVVESLEYLGLLSERYPLKAIPGDEVLYLTAPPRYLELVDKTVEMLENRGRSKAGIDVAVGVYRLRHAWADDRTFYLQDRQVTVPGVASILRNVLAKRQEQSQTHAVRPQPQSRPGLMGKGLASSGHEPQAGLPESLQPSQSPDTPVKQAVPRDIDDDEASIEADPRLNAVIVRDIREKLPAYEAIIHSLDQPGGLVEITANMIDVTVTKGHDWSPPDLTQWLHNGRLLSAQFSLTSDPVVSPTAAGNLVASLTADGATRFFTSITLLEKDNLAHIVARPSVLTINNVEACLTNTETVYVKVAGAYATDLYNVVVGTSLQITPHIIQNYGCNQIQLVVELKDGNFDDTETTDGIPRVKQNTITTQAVLNEGCSLLVGGLRRTEKKHIESRVPGLSSIPLIKNLFTSVSDSYVDYDRIVLITPRIIDIPSPIQVPQGMPTEPMEPIPVPVPMESWPEAPLPLEPPRPVR